MATPYDDALRVLERIANDVLSQRAEPIEHVSLEDSVGRIAARSHKSPVATPPFDTSAMDGYAISSEATIDASEERPAIFTIQGTMAAGDDPFISEANSSDENLSCFEIMTGARFPYSASGPQYDACVRVENTYRVANSHPSKQQIKVFEPVPRNKNRRFAGSDFQEGDLVLEKGQIIRSRHIMALASVGIDKVAVCRRLRAAVWSTGNELRKGASESSNFSHIRDANGPFLTAALRELGVRAEFKGILKDDVNSLLEAINHQVGRDRFDLFLTTGAVSKGLFDFIPPALEASGARIHFHGVAIRPGHPILFACLPSENGDIPFFGLPGNPVATAACFKFLVSPFLRHLMGKEQLQPHAAKIKAGNVFQDIATRHPPSLDNFKHGSFHKTNSGEVIVVLSDNQSPANVAHFAMSRCWAHIPKRVAMSNSDFIYYHPHSLNVPE